MSRAGARECFFIAPIGEEGSAIRARSDAVMRYVVAPAAGAVGLRVVRGDELCAPGSVPDQVLDHVLGAPASVVDLTGANPNVCYELAIRHAAQLPAVLIAERGERLPLDVRHMRTIFFDHTDCDSVACCRRRIADGLREALAGAVGSPLEGRGRLPADAFGSHADVRAACLSPARARASSTAMPDERDGRRPRDAGGGQAQVEPGRVADEHRVDADRHRRHQVEGRRHVEQHEADDEQHERHERHPQQHDGADRRASAAAGSAACRPSPRRRA